MRSIGIQGNGIEWLRLPMPIHIDFSGINTRFHILTSIPNELTPQRLSTRLFRHFEQILVCYRELNECGEHYMLYKGYGFFIEISGLC